MRTITLTTDFGTKDWYVGTMKGVILSKTKNLDVQLVDINHEIQQGNIKEAAFTLRNACPYFPMNSIHTAVVDPGVGSERAPLIIETEGPIFIGPDNGVFTDVLKIFPPKNIYIIENYEWMNTEVSQTFHGRDVFAFSAAKIASGSTPISAGRSTSNIITLSESRLSVKSDSITFEILHIDHFGNLITNIPSATDLERKVNPGTILWIDGLEKAIPIGDTSLNYASMAANTPTFISGSSGYWEVSIKDQSCASKIGFNIKKTPVTACLNMR